MVTQGTLSFKYDVQKKFKGTTQFAGLAIFVEFIFVTGLHKSIQKHICARTNTQGYTDFQMIFSLLLLNLAGGKCVEHINAFEQDNGLIKLIKHFEIHELADAAKSKDLKRWRQKHNRIVPSPTTIFNYLRHYHDPETMECSLSGKAYIPKQSVLQKSLLLVLKDQIHYAQRCNPIETATIDQDATLLRTYKSTALFGYKRYKAYQPVNTYWYEQCLLIHSEFRDGNVSANYDLLRVFIESLEQLPESVKTVYSRTDGAGYQLEILEYCAQGKHKKFGVIQFAISATVCESFKQSVAQLKESDWHDYVDFDRHGNIVNTQQQWAEVNFVTDLMISKKVKTDYRFIAIRECLHDHTNVSSSNLPFPSYDKSGKRYKLFSIVTNRFDMPGNELIKWHRQRCGKSEDLHKEEKVDLSCQYMPSKHFGVNQAFWLIMILAFNLAHMIQRFLPSHKHEVHVNTLRKQIIHIPARVIVHGRQMIIKLDSNKLFLYQTFIFVRKQIKNFQGRDPPALLN